MPITATCPHCSGSFTAPDSTAGKRFKCPSCKQPMTVPTADEAAAAAPADGGGDDVLDIPSPEEAAALVAGGDDADDDDDADEDGDDSKKSKKGKKGKKDKKPKKDKKAKKEKKPKEKKEKTPRKERSLDLEDAGDPSEAFGSAMQSIQRALSPSRMLLGIVGIAVGVFVAVIVGWLLMEIAVAAESMKLMQYGGYGVMALAASSVLLAASAVARVDLADLEDEDAPGPIAAIVKSWVGWIPGLLPAVIIGGAFVGIMMLEGLIGKATGWSYIGPILVLPIGLLFFVINSAAVILIPLALWIAIPVGARGGMNPIGPLMETLGRIKREPGRIFLSYIVFTILVSLVFGVLAGIFGWSAMMSAGNLSGFNPMGALSGGGGGGGDVNFFERMLVAIFGGGLSAVLGGVIIGPFLTAFVCGGCQEIVDHPYEDDDEDDDDADDDDE